MKQHVFVVHLHDATSLHYDFRLQIGDVMPSWAIPKGPPLDNTVKRLAMETTDHSMEYRHFEGVIEEGKYGAGPVMIWDEGTYIPEIEVTKESNGSKASKEKSREEVTDFEKGDKAMKEGLKKGELKFFLHGKRLKGSFSLVKTKNFGPKNLPAGRQVSWLLIKHKDKYVKPGFDAKKITTSVVSGKTIEQIREKTS